MSSVDAATRSMIANLEKNTGRSLADWAALAAAGGTRHGEMVKHLKSVHGLTHGYANLVAHTALATAAQPAADVAPPAPDTDHDPADALYAGPKAGLRPIHEAVMAIVSGFGGDVELAPKKGYISLRRSKQFALIQPATANRVDLGLQLKGREPAGRLEASGSWNAMVSHRVRLTRVEEVDGEVATWLRAAYDAA